MSEVSARVSKPGLALAATGILTLLTGGALLVVQVVALVPSFLIALDSGNLGDLLVVVAVRQGPGLVFLLLTMLGALLTTVSGFRLRSLRSPGVIHVGAALAMLPCCSPCCVLGVFTGGWAIYAMQDDEVRAAMADA